MVDAMGAHGSHIYRVASLIQHYPNFNARLRDSVRELVGKEVEEKLEIGLAKDGSGVGGTLRFVWFEGGVVFCVWLTGNIVAALCALQATKQGH